MDKMEKFWFFCSTEEQWYNIIREARQWFGKNWRSQGKVRRKFKSVLHRSGKIPLPVWFEVPDNRFATWCSVKYSIMVQSDAKINQGK